jgi:hypothetical protein
MISSTHSTVHSFAAIAQAEASLLSLVATLKAVDERHAQAVLKSNNAKEQVLELARSSTGLQDSQLSELLVGIEAFWADREKSGATDTSTTNGSHGWTTERRPRADSLSRRAPTSLPHCNKNSCGVAAPLRPLQGYLLVRRDVARRRYKQGAKGLGIPSNRFALPSDPSSYRIAMLDGAPCCKSGQPGSSVGCLRLTWLAVRGLRTMTQGRHECWLIALLVEVVRSAVRSKLSRCSNFSA